MDVKKVGVIAAVVIAIGLLTWSFSSNFMAGPKVLSEEDGKRIGAQMQESYKNLPPRDPTGRPVSPNPTAGPATR